MSTDLKNSKPIVIVGGGVAGLSAALALGLKGFSVQLFEQADQIGAIGYGVQMGPNVVPMLRALGIEEDVLGASYLPSEIDLLDAYTAQTLMHLPLKSALYMERYQGLPYLAIHRVDLHEVLLKACAKLPHVNLNQSTTVVDYAQDRDEVVAISAEGKEFRASALIAADGLRSKLRGKLHPCDVPKESGYVAHRCLVPMSELPEPLRARAGVSMWTGRGFHVIYYPLRHSSVLNIVLVVKLPTGVQEVSDRAYADYIEDIKSQVAPQAQFAMGYMDLKRRWAIADREPVRGWSDKRVTLLGDSAHATLQSFAQGACMAIEDSVVLAHLMHNSSGDIESVFKEFEKKRFLRTARVQLQSRSLWEDFHCEAHMASVRTARFTEQSSEDFFRCLDWLWTPIALA
jgi:3-hydroxybenzoate 6-monooxygenase